MAEANLTQTEADALMAMEKVRVSDEVHQYPPLGGELAIPLKSRDRREEFILDISRGSIDLRRGKYQNRARHVVVLVRLDFGGAPHLNPDGAVIPCPHLHVYREGYGDKWAMPASGDHFGDTTDSWRMLEGFFRYCNIVEPPNIQKGLFA